MIQLSDHFDCKRLLRFTFPSIIMMVFTSIYGVVDGFFVSNYAGKTPFAAVNFIFPVLIILGCPGFMLGTGGSALIAKTMGEGDKKRANQIFSLLIYVGAAAGVVLGAAGIALLPSVAVLLGAEGRLLADCVTYGRIILLAGPFFMLQMEFQCLFATAEKPKLGLTVTVAAGVTNMVLDWLLVGVFRWGLVGAAAATAVSQAVGGVIPLIYFARENSSLLRLTRCPFDGAVLLKTCANGSSELMSNISMSVVSMLYNGQLMAKAGEDGVAAYGVLMYVSMVFQAIFIGYAVGTAPVVGYHHGAGNRGELKGLLRRSVLLIGGFSAAMCLAGETLGRPLSVIFVGYDPELLDMTAHAFAIFSVAFLFSGFAIFGSSFFTALNDGLTSALISFLRLFLFRGGMVILLPLFLKLDGIWLAVVVADALGALIAVLLIWIYRKRYGYL